MNASFSHAKTKFSDWNDLFGNVIKFSSYYLRSEDNILIQNMFTVTFSIFFIN